MTEESTGSDTTSFLSAVATEQSNSTQIIKQENNHQWITNKQTNVQTDNTKRRAGGRAGWRAVLPNEKHELSTGWRAAQKSGPAVCTTGLAGGLHIKGGQRAAH